MADNSAFSGAASGAGAGTAFGPWGAAIGAGLGIAGGILGNSAGAAARGEANNDMIVANQIIQELQNAPDISKPLILEKYRQAGVLTPQMEQYISAGPSNAAGIQSDQSSIDAQRQALQQMSERANGGLTAADRAAIAQTQAQARSDEQAKQQQIIQQAQAQMGGAGASGASLAAKLMNSQSGANQEAANMNQIAAAASQNALQAASMQGQMGSQLNNSLFNQGMQRAQAADEMNRFNTQNQIAAQQRNVASGNQAQASNLANAQNTGNMNTAGQNNEMYNQLNRQMQQWQVNTGLAQMKANSLQNLGNFNMGQGNQQAQSMYNMFSGAGQAIGGAMNGMQAQSNYNNMLNAYNNRTNAMAASPYMNAGSAGNGLSGFGNTGGGYQMIGYEGGDVHDYRDGGRVKAHNASEKAEVPGDSLKNDKIKALLSEHEIVVPREIAQTPLGHSLLDLIEKKKEVKRASKPAKMADGGETQGQTESDLEMLKKLFSEIKGDITKSPWSLPKPTPSPSPNYADGGDVDPGFQSFMQQHPSLDPTIAKTAYQYYLSKAPAQVQRQPAQNPDAYQNFAEKANDPNRQGYADGGDVDEDEHKAERLPAEEKSKKRERPDSDSELDDVESDQEAGDENIKKMADGGDPVTGNVDPNSDEGLDMIRNADDAAYAPAPKVDDSSKDEEVQPTDDVDASKLESKYASEDSKAKEAADDSDEDTDVASKDDDSEDDESDDKSSDSRNLEGMTLGKDEALAQNPQPDSSALSGLLASMKPQHNAMAEAQRQRAMNLAMDQMQRGSALMGAGIAKADPSAAMANIADQEKYAGLPMQEYQEKLANQQNDPNSNVSQVMRNYLAGKGMKVPDSASAADILKVAPYLAKDQALQNAMTRALMNITARHNEGEANRQNSTKNAQIRANAITKGQEASEKRLTQREFDGVQKNLVDLASKSDMGKDLYRTNKIFVDTGVNPEIDQKEIETLPSAKLNKLNRIQVIEAAMSMNRYLTGSAVPAQQTLDHLIPNNRNMVSTQLEDFINNKLNPADQAAAIRAYLQIAARGRDRARQQLGNMIKIRTAGSSHLFNMFPEQTKAINSELESQGYGPNVINPANEQGQFTANKSPTPTNQPQQQLAPNEVARKTKDGKIAIFDSGTKQFLRYQ